MKGPFTVSEMARRVGSSGRTIRRWLTDPEKIDEMGWHVETTPAVGGNSAYRIFETGETPAQEASPDAPQPVALAAADPCLCAVAKSPDKTIDDKFEGLLHKKIMHKTGANRAALERYYRRLFEESGEIPGGLLHRDGRKAAGRPGGLDDEVEARFCQLVQAAAESPRDDPRFITRNLRKVTVFHRMLCAEFGAERVSMPALYRAKKKYNLTRFFEMPDYPEDENGGGEIYYFNPEAVWDLVQMDGCEFDYIELKDELGRWRKPVIIELYDTGSRFMIAMDIYFSESAENSVDVFSQFLKALPIPKKTIRLRPDKAMGFQNLKRVVHELNLKCSTPEGFFMDSDFPRAYNPKAKVHLETSHRRLHLFEAWILARFPDRIVERRMGKRFATNGRIEKNTISRMDMTIEEFRETGILEEYRTEHNHRPGKFSVAGERREWRPAERMAEYLDSVDTFTLTDEDVESFIRYGYEKKKATVQKSGRITFQKQEWKVVDGDFSRTSSTPVKVSEVNGKLVLFEPKPDGVAIGEAMPVGKYDKPKFVEKRQKARIKENEYELVRSFLETAGMVVNEERLLGMYNEGLNLSEAMRMVKENEHRYNNPRFGEKGGFIAFNLFISDWLSRKAGATVKPYAAAN